MTVVLRHLTNTAYGFPRGRARRVVPVALACIHVTGNRRTAAYADLHAAALAERNYANRSGSDGPSAHFYVARDGWAVEAIDPVRYAAWSNGDVEAPHTANPGIRRVLAFRAKGYNANEAYWEEFELVGDAPSGKPVTKAQERFVAERIAARAQAARLPINRETVHGHWEINGVDRRNCPVPYAGRELFLERVIALARSFMPAPQEDAVLPITDETPMLVDLVRDAPIFDLDGDRIGKVYTPKTALPSPWGTGPYRFVAVTTGGVRRPILILAAGANARALPTVDVTVVVNAALDRVAAAVAAARPGGAA